ncbi:hypothetical protein FACS189447_07730 [Spirochaetia bacterium]|nr:hypothetical protein FACS189447_07730 [Spirochaetia bacterium]
MTVFEAESIKSDFIVSMQFAEQCGKKKEEAYTETAKKYTREELIKAFVIINNNLEKEKDFIHALFILAIRSKT